MALAQSAKGRTLKALGMIATFDGKAGYDICHSIQLHVA